MSYWKGFFVAAAMDLVFIMGCPSSVTGPDVARTTPPHAAVILDLGTRLNELMIHLSEHPTDVTAIEKVARLYIEQGWHEQAVGPLARALQIDPTRRSLWVALDDALEEGGLATITDAELERRAAEFVEAVEMWGHGC